MEQIATISISGIKLNEKDPPYYFSFIFCSDWKFMALVLGLKAANSTYFCPYCTCSKGERDLLELDWSNYSRNWESDDSLCTKCQNDKKKSLTCRKDNHQYSPGRNLLQDPFTMDDCVVDVLHIILRTSDVLESILYSKVDEFALCGSLRNQCVEGGMIKKICLEDYSLICIGIPLQWIKFNDETHISEWSTLNCEERVNLWKTIDFSKLFVNTTLECEVPLWNQVVCTWLHIISYLDCLHIECDCALTPKTFAAEVKKLCRQLTPLKPTSVVTPYFHTLVYHVPRMLSKHQTLKKFSTSAQELKNSTQTLFQFRQSNQHNIPLDLEINQLCQLWFLCNPLPEPSCDEPRRFPRFNLDTAFEYPSQ